MPFLLQAALALGDAQWPPLHGEKGSPGLSWEGMVRNGNTSPALNIASMPEPPTPPLLS